MHKRFIIIKSKATIVSYLFAIAMMIFAFFGPASFFDENGPVETCETLALICGVIFCFIEYRKNRDFKHVFLTTAFLLLIFIGRETSWGRVFFADENGIIPKRKDWIFGPYIYYVLAPIFTAVLIHAIKTKFIPNIILLLQKAPIMPFEFILAVVLTAISYTAERHGLPNSLVHLSYELEESAEIALYFVISMVIFTYSNKNLLVGIKK